MLTTNKINDFDSMYSVLMELNFRGLYYSSNWLSSILLALNVSHNFNAGPALELKYLNAKSYFDLRDYDKCSKILENSNDNLSQFLYLYSLYLSGEKRKIEGMGMILSKEERKEFNPFLDILEHKLSSIEQMDSYLLYLFGVILSRSGKKKRAKSVLVESLKHCKYNWSCFKELLGLLSSFEEAKQIIEQLLSCYHSSDISLLFFQCSVIIEFHPDPRTLFDTYFNQLSSLLPKCHALDYLKGSYFYTVRDYEEAENVFEQMFHADPSQLDFVDSYSNILFVKENKVKLSQLAQSCVKIDKFRPESCCVIGNYFSLKGEHEKAIFYFRRALRLDRNYLSAWTLMGHEFLELGNSNAAIESYRRAIEISERDYRAWFGLGQTYEMLSMSHFALFYYRKACALRPIDSRMWTSLAMFYENLDRLNDAFCAYQRAIKLSYPFEEQKNSMKIEIPFENYDIAPQEATLWNRYAKICDKMGKSSDAVQWFKRILTKGIRPHLSSQDVIDAYMYLARYYKNKGLFKEAEEYLSQLMEFGGPDKEEAKALMKEMGSSIKTL